MVGLRGEAAVRMKLTGASPAPQAAAWTRFLGNDPRQWRTNVPTYARVRYARASRWNFFLTRAGTGELRAWRSC